MATKNNPDSAPCLPPLTLSRARRDEKTIFANIDDYEYRLEHALFVMDRQRCPLARADGALYNQMCDAVADYIADNGLAADYDFDVEQIVF
jgi:hypothetical protein